MSRAVRNGGSFRDPSGAVFTGEGGEILRSVNPVYRENYGLFLRSGLKDALVSAGLLIPFGEVPEAVAPGAFATLRAERVEFISYPYEWSFTQLKDAALLTLEIQRIALEHGMMLKDASACNVQFRRGRPVFIDLLSFESAGDRPWNAYGQFCSHFLAPLALAAKRDIGFNALMAHWLDGIPLELASKLLPWSTRFSPGLLFHIHLHAKMQRRHFDGRAAAEKAKRVRVSIRNKLAFTGSLKSAVKALRRPGEETEWADYYDDTNYSDAAFAAKKELVSRIAAELRPKRVLDLGANTGVFSRLALRGENLVVAADVDPAAVDRHYRALKREKIAGVLPLRIDLTNPTPAIGWGNAERESFFSRCRFDLVMALALVHHIAITHNVPLPMIAETLAGLGETLVIEFVPKEDSQLQRLLATREDIFSEYHTEGFLRAFEPHFELIERLPIRETKRELFVFRRRRADGAV
ncbi:MAG: class I SAM-dependent methyltransferase [Lentisphaeria bacterium]|nr:class I SAM-dependent methyltransferase [Lentisphaeria bacterium]